MPDAPTPNAAAPDWLDRLEEATGDSGYLETLGLRGQPARHWAFFTDESPTLIVSFVTAAEIRGRSDGLPPTNAVAAGRGWSQLCLIAEGETWFRDPAVWAYFDRLVDDAFFDDFDQVVFTGAGMGGYAACAYSVAAPGSTVLAFSPRATLDPALAGWDGRDRAARRLDFTTRYGFGPDMVEGAGRVFVLYDPDLREDAMHAALFRGPHVTRFATPRLQGRVGWAFDNMQQLAPLLDAAGNGHLTPQGIATAWRARRGFGPYLRATLERTDAAGRIALSARICRSVASRLRAPRFTRRLAEITAIQSARQGQTAVVDGTSQ